jgi:GNAT superfamily N-acetyltransferase
VSLAIRSARPQDAPLIVQFVRELAEYEKLLHECRTTEGMIEDALFSPNPRVFCDIAEWDGQPAGNAIWFLNFSTFSGRPGIYLEDIFVRPQFRGKGIGKALMVHLARKCVENNWTRFEWQVLDWNTPSIEFYRSLGAELKEEWTTCRVSGDALKKLGSRA